MTNLYKRLVNWYGENKQARKVERKRRRERRKREREKKEGERERERERERESFVGHFLILR